MGGLFTGVIGQWLLRRAMEVGGLIGGAVLLYQGLDPTAQDAVQRILTGGWREVPLGALVPIGLSIWGYVWSFRSTVKPHVTVDGQQTSVKKLPADKQTVVKEAARTAVAKRPTIAEQLGKLFGGGN